MGKRAAGSDGAASGTAKSTSRPGRTCFVPSAAATKAVGLDSDEGCRPKRPQGTKDRRMDEESGLTRSCKYRTPVSTEVGIDMVPVTLSSEILRLSRC